jgi:transposase
MRLEGVVEKTLLTARLYRLRKKSVCMKRHEGFHRAMRYVSSMRGNDEQQGAVFSYINPEERIPAAHPLRSIRAMVDRALKELWAHFEALYGRRGRPSIPPEKLLRALLLQILYAIRSERQLMEQLDYNLLYRWFVGLNPDDAVWDVTVFTKNRERLLQGEIAQRLLEAVLAQAREQHLLSEEHFTVDGTLIEAWASRRSFGPKDPPPTVGTGVGGKKLLRDTHVSSTDPEARLYKKSTAGEVQASYLGHVIIENRKGLVVAACATPSSATAEREAALQMLEEMGRSAREVSWQTPAITLGADRLYQEEKFIAELRRRKIAPHVAEYEPNPHWPNWLTEAERRDPGFAISQKKRKLIEKVFGWGKLDSILRQVKLRGARKVDWFFRFLATAANLVRMVKLIPAG